MNYLYSKTENLYNKKVSASGLALFRVFYGLVLLFEVVQLFYFRHLVFDKIPYFEPSEIDFTIPLVLWMVSISCIILGFFTRFSSVINYLFSIVFLSTISSYEYHMFYAYMGVNFLLMFVNTYQVFSFDRLKMKLKYSNSRTLYKPSRKVSVLNYYILILVAIGFVYFDSIFFKLASPLWLKGLGVWLPASLPHFTHINTSFLLNLKWLILFLGYLTFVFETTFIFTFFRKKWRLPLLIVGIGLHFGILICFPIPWFALGVMSIYILMIPHKFISRVRQYFNCNTHITFYYDEECPLCIRAKIIISHLDFFNVVAFKGVQTYGFEEIKFKNISREELLDNIYSITKKGKILIGVNAYRFILLRIPSLLLVGLIMYIPPFSIISRYIYSKVASNRNTERCTEDNCGYTPPSFPQEVDSVKILKDFSIKDLKIKVISLSVIIILFFQINVTYHSLLINNIKENIGFSETNFAAKVNIPSKVIYKLSSMLLGITSHAVFMDAHMDDYNHIIAVQVLLPNGDKRFIPLIDENGYPDYYNYSFNWVKYTFRVNSPNIDQAVLSRGLRDFTAFWLHKNNLENHDIKFNILVKKIDSPENWSYDFLNNQIAKPWIDAGYIMWESKTFSSHTKDIERL